MSLFDLTGRVALVTGASSGLGADAALAYARQGADVALFARRKDKLEETAKKVEALGRKALIVPCDVTQEEQVKAGVASVIDTFGKIDILLNNAGVATAGSVEQLSVEDWDFTMNINVKGIFLMCKHVLPHMREAQYGRIINTGSINSILGSKDLTQARHAYNTSKAAVHGLTAGMAASYGAYNITVNSINPALFESEMTEDTLFKIPGYVELYSKMVPISRPGRQGELNSTIIYLSSESSGYVTGQNIFIDGGLQLI